MILYRNFNNFQSYSILYQRRKVVLLNIDCLLQYIQYTY